MVLSVPFASSQSALNTGAQLLIRRAQLSAFNFFYWMPLKLSLLKGTARYVGYEGSRLRPKLFYPSGQQKSFLCRASKSCRHAVARLRRFFKHLPKKIIFECKTVKTGTFYDFGTIWQNSFRFQRFLWHFMAQNFQSEISACAKELTIRRCVFYALLAYF